MERRNSNRTKFKLSGILTGLFSLCTVGISLYMVNQNRKILNHLKSSSDENPKVKFAENKDVPMSIHRTIDAESDLPKIKRRFLTG